MNREKLELVYFFDAGYDKRTGECDVEGTEVIYDGKHVGCIKWVTPDDLEEMDDDTLEEYLYENDINI